MFTPMQLRSLRRRQHPEASGGHHRRGDDAVQNASRRQKLCRTQKKSAPILWINCGLEYRAVWGSCVVETDNPTGDWEAQFTCRIVPLE
jgi:hypothetical protein